MNKIIRNEVGRFIKAIAQDTNKNGTAGRPEKIDQRILQLLREAFLLGCTDEEACLYAGICTSTLYNYQNDYPEFTEQKAQLKQQPFIVARMAVIRDMAKDGSLALRYLERKKRDEFDLRQEPKVNDASLFVSEEQALKILKPFYEELKEIESNNPSSA